LQWWIRSIFRQNGNHQDKWSFQTLQGTVTHVDDDGLWISGDAIIAEIADAGGLQIALNTPAVFVPTVQLLWLIASNE
jgi:hypothetical protein